MKIFFAVERDSGLDSRIDNRFGRAACFLIYDTEIGGIESVEKNPFLNQAHGVGIQVANHILKQKCQVAVGAIFGPKVEAILNAGNVKIITVENSTVKDIVENLNSRI